MEKLSGKATNLKRVARSVGERRVRLIGRFAICCPSLGGIRPVYTTGAKRKSRKVSIY
jgi:hypothetical protein